jgi:hypothetical protein
MIDIQLKSLSNNLNQLGNGQKQLQGYLSEVESIFGKGWTTKLDTYYEDIWVKKNLKKH